MHTPCHQPTMYVLPPKTLASLMPCLVVWKKAYAPAVIRRSYFVFDGESLPDPIALAMSGVRWRTPPKLARNDCLAPQSPPYHSTRCTPGAIGCWLRFVAAALCIRLEQPRYAWRSNDPHPYPSSSRHKQDLHHTYIALYRR